MMKTAVLTQEPGASPGVTTDSFSPVSHGDSSSASTPADAAVTTAPRLPLSPSVPVPRPPPSALHRITPSTPAPICASKSSSAPPLPAAPSPLSKQSSTSTDGPSPAPHKPPAPAVPRPAAPHPTKPFVPPLPTHKPSTTPPQTRPPPPLNAKVSSPPLPRPPRPSVSRTPSTGGLSAAQPSASSAPTSNSTSTTSSSTAASVASSLGASTTTTSAAAATSASASVLPSISILEKLIKTCPVWLQLGVTKERATNILHKEGPRVFLVRKDPGLKAMVLVVRLPDQGGAPQIQEVVVKEEKTLTYLEGSVLVFDNIFKLIAFYCVSRDILPFTLRLPQAIIEATKYEAMEIISTLGLEFWGSSLNSRAEADVKSPGGEQGSSSCEIQLSAGGDRLWYINPVFVEDHCSSLSSPSPSTSTSSPPVPVPQPVLRSQSLNTPSSTSSASPAPAPGPGPKYKRPPPLPPRPLGASEGLSSSSSSSAKPSAGTSAEAVASSHAQGLPVGPKPPSPAALAAAAAHTQARAKEEGCGERESSADATRGGVDREDPAPKKQQTQTQTQAQQTSTTTTTAPQQTHTDGTGGGGAPAVVPPQRQNSSGKGKRPPVGRPPSFRVPPVPRRRPSDKQASEDTSGGSASETPNPAAPVNSTTTKEVEGGSGGVVVPVGTLICLDGTDMEVPKLAAEVTLGVENAKLQRSAGNSDSGSPAPLQDTVAALPVSPVRRRGPPVPPPRSKRLSAVKPSTQPGQANGPPSQEPPLAPTSPEFSSLPVQGSSGTPPQPTRRSLSVDPKFGDVSIYSPDAAAGSFPQHRDNDSYSTSSAEDDTDPLASSGGAGGNSTSAAPAGGGGGGGGGGGSSGGGGYHAAVKRTPTIMLDRAKQRLSMVNFSSVFTGMLSAELKLQKRVVELSRDAGSYFGCLVRDHRAFTLETLRKHASSTEMLQEIRQMMTQLKSYLIQSAEIQSLQEPNVFSDEKLEVIIEAALCKSVLKPIRESIYSRLRDIHTRDGTLKKLRENQQVVLNTTTTDLGVTTCVPETAIMEKITQKLGRLHQEYSPQKKIDTLLKTCKLIYDSMSVGSQGKAHGADDFLPVLMYVLARSNMTELLLDVEYMMELMDPALQLGEGSYYLTTTYGALEHIKSYDKEPVTRTLSLEVQDSINRWERRRTLNKARVSRSSVQDFINVSLLEAGANTKTLGVRASTSAQDLCAQCADKFEVLDPESYCLSVLVDGVYKSLGPEEKPLEVKSALHHSEPRKEYYFVYRLGRWPESTGEVEAGQVELPEPETQLETEPEAEPEPEPETQSEAELANQLETETETQMKAEEKPEADAEPAEAEGAEPQGEPQAEEADEQVEVHTEAAAEVEAEAEAEESSGTNPPEEESLI
ncbi:ras and Rab interactor 3 [Engraulis encrasicolus]|uniref:ras and Rab interactor 3 n=1 Tax=Engraulis encrasicolus TaxID=184585 RepID=UPI002FCED79C